MLTHRATRANRRAGTGSRPTATLVCCCSHRSGSSGAAGGSGPQRAPQQQGHEARAPTQQPRQQQAERRPWAALRSALGAAAVAASLLVAGPTDPAAAARSQSLADAVRAQYPALNKAHPNDLITRADLEEFEAKLWLAWLEQGRPLTGNGDPDFCLKLFDLNQDGRLTSEEVLRSLAIDGAVNEGAERVVEQVFRVFDANGNGMIDAREWQSTLGDLGPDGEGAKRYIFYRVDRLSNSDGQLDPEDFANAMTLARDIILGGGPAASLVSYENSGF